MKVLDGAQLLLLPNTNTNNKFRLDRETAVFRVMALPGKQKWNQEPASRARILEQILCSFVTNRAMDIRIW